jgi:long-subunit fatty acid transport protein
VNYTVLRNYDFSAVNNLSLGAEYYLTKTVAMRAGFFTDFANTKKISSDKINQDEHIDLYGTTFSISRFTRNTSVTLGSGYTYGKGEAQIIGGSNKVQDAVSQGWMLFLSSSYSY